VPGTPAPIDATPAATTALDPESEDMYAYPLIQGQVQSLLLAVLLLLIVVAASSSISEYFGKQILTGCF
jgi:hypothetical protein